MQIYPAIDLRGGRVVRLSQGDYDRMTVYGDDPVHQAREFLRAGATCLHAVDLDGAREGRPMNRDIIGALCQLGLYVEVGGGMRNEAAVEDTLALGVNRVILGTAAVTDFDFTTRLGRRFGERLAVGVDVKDGKVATHGWREVTDIDGADFCRRLTDVGVRTVIYTDIARDGMLTGPNIEALKKVLRAVSINVIASGGISNIDDIKKLLQLEPEGLYGAITGRALYEGTLDLKEALSLC